MGLRLSEEERGRPHASARIYTSAFTSTALPTKQPLNHSHLNPRILKSSHGATGQPWCKGGRVHCRRHACIRAPIDFEAARRPQRPPAVRRGQPPSQQTHFPPRMWLGVIWMWTLLFAAAACTTGTDALHSRCPLAPRNKFSRCRTR